MPEMWYTYGTVGMILYKTVNLKGCDSVDLSQFFSQYPNLRELLTAVAVIFVDICGLVILMSAVRERNHGDALWTREGHGLMLKCGQDVFPLGAAEVVIGRHPASDIRFTDPELSRFHALITLSNGKWRIEDLGGANGVTVNGTRITAPKTLHTSDVIVIGKRKFTVIKGKREEE